ncbi:hypothetical protein D3C84_957390 [compost metagenome]
MGTHQHGRSGAFHFDEPFQQRADAKRIEPEKRLINNEQRRVCKQCIHDHDLLLHPFGQMLREGSPFDPHMEFIQQPLAPVRVQVSFYPISHARQPQMLINRQLVEQNR